MQENTPREVELNFSANEEHIEDLEAARAELSGELNAMPETELAAPPEPETSSAEQPEATAAETPAPEPEILRSRQPVNRPAGTPPLSGNSTLNNPSMLEQCLNGKSYGAALRMLREHKNLSYKDLEQIMLIQPRYLEALENEDLDALPPLVYVIAYIRGLARFYKLSSDTSDRLVAQLKEKMQYACNDEFINSLEVDRSGQEANDRKLKRLLGAFVGGVLGIVLITVLLIVLLNNSVRKNVPAKTANADGNPAAESAAVGEGEFDPNTIYALLEPPTLDLPRLPAGQ